MANKVTIFFISIIWISQIYAIESPLNTVQSAFTKILSVVKSDPGNNPKICHEEIKNILAPYIDFNEMSKWVAGRNAWKNALSKEKTVFVENLSSKITTIYTSFLLKKLANIQDYTLEFIPLRCDYNTKEKILVSVKLKNIKGNSKSVQLDFRLINKGNIWQFYDFAVGGVGMLQGFQELYSMKSKKSNVKYASL